MRTLSLSLWMFLILSVDSKLAAIQNNPGLIARKNLSDKIFCVTDSVSYPDKPSLRDSAVDRGFFLKYSTMVEDLDRSLSTGTSGRQFWNPLSIEEFLIRWFKPSLRNLQANIASRPQSTLSLGLKTLNTCTRILRKLYADISDEFQVNSVSPGTSEHHPFILALTDNTQVIFYPIYEVYADLFGQMFDQNWGKIDSEFQINDISTVQEIGIVRGAVLNSGSYVLTWNTQDNDIYARIYDKSVSKGPDFIVNTGAASASSPGVSALNDGGFVIAWADSEIHAQIFDHEGNRVGSEIVASTYTTGTQSASQVAAFPNGGFVVTWCGEGLEDNFGVYAQIFDSSASPVGSQFLANTHTTNDQSYPSIAVLKDGRFVIAWQSHGQDGSYAGIFAQIFDSSGAKIADEFQSNQNSSGDQKIPFIRELYDGGFIIAWQDSNGHDGSSGGAYGRRYDQYGNESGDEFRINQYTAGDQLLPASGALKCGFVNAWQSHNQGVSGIDIYARVYTDSFSSLRLNYPLQDLNLYKHQSFSFVVPENTFHTTSTDPITYSAHILVDGKYTDMDYYWLNFDETTRTFSGTPTEEQTISVQVEAYDGCGYVVENFQITVSGNLKPVANALIPNQVLPFSKEEIWEYYVPKNAFKDLEGDPIIYTGAMVVVGEDEVALSTVWESLAFDTDDGKLYGIPNLSGSFVIRIYADDGIEEPDPTPVEMTVEIVSQGIEVLELYQINQKGLKGLITSDDAYFWITNNSNLKRFDISSGNPYLITGPSIEYNFSHTITAIIEISHDRLAIGDEDGNLKLLSSTSNSELSSLALGEAISDIYNDDDDCIYTNHGQSVSVVEFTSGSLVLSMTIDLSVSLTSIAKGTNKIYTGTENGLYAIDISTHAAGDLSIPNLSHVDDMVIYESNLYILKSNEFCVVDISDENAPSIISTRTLDAVGTFLEISKIDNDLLVFISEGDNGLSIINASNPLILSSEGYYSSITSVNSAYISSVGTWGIVLKGSEVFTIEIFRRAIQLQVCDTESDPCTHQLETQAQKDFSKDVSVVERFPTFKSDFIYSLSYTFSVFEVSGSDYRSAPDWLSSSKVDDKLFRLSGQASEYLVGSVVDLEVRGFAFQSNGESLLTLKKIVSLSVVPRHAAVVVSIPDQSLQVGEEWVFSFSSSVFSDGDHLECEYYIDSEWIKSYDITYIQFSPSSRQWYIAITDSTKETLFGCDPCSDSELSKTYGFKVTAKNSASDSDPGVSTTFNLYLYSGRIPDQQTHPGISQTIILDESIFPSGVEYTVSLLDSNGDSQNLPWWMSYISNERKILMFPSSTEIDQDFDIQVSENNNGVELSSQFQIQVRNDPPVAVEQLQNQRVKLGAALDYSFSAGTFSDPDGDSLIYRIEWKKEDGTQTTAIPSWINFSENTLTFYGSPSVQGSYDLLVYANDGLGGEISVEFVIEAYNNSPYRNPSSQLPDQTIHIGVLFTLTLSSNLFIDADADILSYTASQSDGSELPSWLNFNPSNLYFSGTPSSSDIIGTSVSIQITATDGYSSSPASFAISVTNSSPEATSIQDQTVHIGKLFSLSLSSTTFTDPDEDDLAYTVLLDDGSPLPSWLIFNSVTLSFSGTPVASELENTSLDIEMSVSDGYSSAESSFSLNITNSGPEAGSIENQTVHIGTMLSLTLPSNTFTDDDGDLLVYTVSQVDGSPLPIWLAFNSFNLQFSGTPSSPELENTSLDIKISVSDGYSSAETTFQISITNSAPAAGSIENQSVHIGTLFSLTLPSNSFTDDDGDVLEYTVSQVDGSSIPTWLAFNSISLQFSGTPSSPELENTSLDIKISVSDGYGSAETSFSLSITNSDPQEGSIEDQSVHIGTVFSLTLSSNLFTDDDGDLLEYTVNQVDGSPLPAWLVFNSFSLLFSGTPSSPELENTSLDIKISVSDGYSSAETSFSLSITNSDPQAGSIEDQSVHIGTLFSLNLPFYLFTDDDGDLLEYTVNQVDGSPLPTWLVFNSFSLLFSGTPSSPELENTSLDIKISASDGYSSAETSFSLSITNFAPQAGSIEDQSVHIGTLFSLTMPPNLFTDQDGDSLEYTVNQVDGSPLPAWLIFNPNIYQFSGTPTSSEFENTTVNIRVSVSDNYSDAETTFAISITNQGPTLANSLSSQVNLALEQGFIKLKPGVQFEFIFSSNTFNDGDHDILVYSSRLSNGDPLPEWLSFDPNTQQFYGTPVQVQAITVSVTASDGYASVSDTVELDIINKLPTLNRPLQEQFDALYPDPFVQGFYFSFQFAFDSFTDEDDSLSYSAVFSENGGDWRSLEFIWVELEGRSFSGTVSATSLSNSTLSLQVTASDGQESVSDSFSFSLMSLFPSSSSNSLHIDSIEDSIEVEIFTNGPKIAVFSYGTLSVLDTSNNEMTSWKIQGSPTDINYVLDNVKYRPSSNRLLSESKVFLKINGEEQEYSISVFDGQEPITSSSISSQNAYIDSTFNLGIKKYFNYSDESKLSYSFIIEEKPKGYKDWLNFESGVISGITTNPEEIGSYKLTINVTDEFNESESESFSLEVDYTQLQKYLNMLAFAAQFVGPAFTIIGLLAYRALILNYLTKKHKTYAPILLGMGRRYSRGFLILRPDEERMARQIYKKLPVSVNLEQQNLISSIENAVKEINRENSRNSPDIGIAEDEGFSPPASNSPFEQKLRYEEAPIIKIKGCKYHLRYLYFCIKDHLYRHSLSKIQLIELDNMIKDFKTHMLDRKNIVTETLCESSIAERWIKCKDSWTLDMPDYTQTFKCDSEEVNQFLEATKADMNIEMFLNCIKIEQWKDRAVRTVEKGILKQLELHYKSPFLCKFSRKRYIADWLWRDWLFVNISDNELIVKIDSSKKRIPEELYAQVHDIKGFLVCQFVVLPTLNISQNNTFLDAEYRSDKIFPMKDSTADQII